MKYRMLEKGEKVRKGQIIRIAKASKTTYWYAKLIGERFKVTRSKGKDIYVSYHGLLYNFLVFPRDIQVADIARKSRKDLKACLLEELDRQLIIHRNAMNTCTSYGMIPGCHEDNFLYYMARIIWYANLIDRVEEL